MRVGSSVAPSRRTLLRTGLAAGVALRAGRARAEEKVTYLFPAPPFLPAFVPHHLAQQRGYFHDEGVAVTFQTGRGGADVAKQVAVGNAEIGGASGDTPIIVRANGLPVLGVALLGGHPLYKIGVRADRNIRDLTALKGHKIGVIAFGDTGYYALLGLLAGVGLKREDVQIQAVGPAGMTQLMISGELDAITATPDWAVVIENAGIKMAYLDIEAVFPAMGQAIVTSDQAAKARPDAIRGVVRAVLRGMTDCIADPAAAAKDFVLAVPQQAGKTAEIEQVLRRYVADVYPIATPADLGKFDSGRMERVQSFYLANNIIQRASPVADLFSNAFV